MIRTRIRRLKEMEREIPFEKACERVSAFRRTYSERFSQEMEKKRRMYAGLLLEELLADEGFSGPYIYEKGIHGKPYLRECPYCFSISHSGDFIASSISDRPVGVDIEQIGLHRIDRQEREKIAERFFDPVIASDPQIGEEQTFLRLWTRAESYAKMRGVPLGRVFSEIGNERGCSIRSMEEDDYIAAVCSGDDPAEESVEKI